MNEYKIVTEKKCEEDPSAILLDSREVSSMPSSSVSYGAIESLDEKGYTLSCGTTYVEFLREDYAEKLNQQVPPNFGWKLHVSVKEDLNNVFNAWKIVVPIATEYKLCSFKCKRGSRLMEEQDGKVITLYLVSNPELSKKPCCKNILIHEMINKIEHELETAGIVAGRKPDGDAQIQDSNYCYYRNEAGEISPEFTEEYGHGIITYYKYLPAKEPAKIALEKNTAEIKLEKKTQEYNPYEYEDNFDLGGLQITPPHKGCCVLL